MDVEGRLDVSSWPSVALISPSLISSDSVRDLGAFRFSGHQATLPFLLLSASKVAGHSALSVERVPVDPCVCH